VTNVRGGSGASDFNEYSCNIVMPAPLIGQSDKSVADALKRLRLGEVLGKLFVRHKIGKAVGTQEEPIAISQILAGPKLDLDLRGDPEGTRNAVSIRVALGLLARELPCRNPSFNHRVIDGEGDELAVSESVGAGIPCMGNLQ
jgi:hypothetical protein